jgi:hypothetical protein
MMGEDDSEPKVMSIAERIAALNNKCDRAAPLLPPQPSSSATSTKPKAKADALASRIAALQQNAKSSTSTSHIDIPEKPKVGKLKPQDGAPMITFGSGPPPSLLKKQKEREERMEKLQMEAKSMDAELGGGDATTSAASKPKVGKLNMPAGAVPIMAFGAGPPPPLLLKKQREREELMEKLREEARLAEEGESSAT